MIKKILRVPLFIVLYPFVLFFCLGPLLVWLVVDTEGEGWECDYHRETLGRTSKNIIFFLTLGLVGDGI